MKKYSIWYTVEEGGKERYFGDSDEPISTVVERLRGSKIHDMEASVPHAYSNLAPHVYVSSVIFKELRQVDHGGKDMKPVESHTWLGAYHASADQFVFDEAFSDLLI